MLNLELSIQQNRLKTRKELCQALDQLTVPLSVFYSKGKARVELGQTGTSYPSSVAGMEGFSRVLWGLVPLLAGGGSSALWESCLQGIKNGTDPLHEEYWGEISDYDQRAVEMAAYGFALALIPDKIWEPLTEREKENLASWLRQINQFEVYDCNWLFFPVLVNLGLKRVGEPYDLQKITVNLDRIDQFYLENGWYEDGVDAHCDYYGPFAIHFYSLLYAKWMGNEDPVRAERYKSRAASFARDFIYWFSGDGSGLPYGRSLAYRFAQSAFWGALVYADVEALPIGVVKGLILRNLRWWLKQPILDKSGLLSIGYRYPNLVMAENYNAPGSPYWGLKAFLPLIFPEKHSFWKAEELPLPPLKEKVVQKPPRFIICRQEEKNHVLAFNAGYKHTNEHPHVAGKYEKFVYSSFFGFSVPKAEWGLSQGAFDSILALSEGDNLYRVKRRCEEYKVNEQTIYVKWKPWDDVEIKTWLLTGTPWHIRIHSIDTSRVLDCADGGFALGLEMDGQSEVKVKTILNRKDSLAATPWGASGIMNIHGDLTAELIYPNANTNIMHTRTVIPTVTTRLKPGKHLIVNAVFGEPGSDMDQWDTVPKVEIKDGGISISGHGFETTLIQNEAFPGRTS